MKRIHLLIIFFLFKGLYAYPQQDNVITTEGDSLNNIYYNSLNFFMENLEEVIQHLAKTEDSIFKIQDAAYKNLYILDSDFTAKYLTKYKSSRLSIISEDELKEIIGRGGGGERKRLEVVPLGKNKKYFFVNILFYRCKINENDRLYYPYINNGTSLMYKFNCDSNTFEFVRTYPY